MFGSFMEAFTMGFALAAAVGPITFICLRIGLLECARACFIAGLGVAMADGFYGLLAAFGLAFIMSFLKSFSIFGISIHDFLQYLGGLFIIYLGGKILFSKTQMVAHSTDKYHADNKKPYKYFLLLFSLTLANPMTILVFLSLFSVLIENGENHTNGLSIKILMTFGICLGSLLWWGILSVIVQCLRDRIKAHMLILIGKISGVFIAFSGIYMLIFSA